jgi:AraC-like DNA-binding protein
MNRQKAINDLCARLFREPERLVGIFAERLHAPLYQPVHRHSGLLQLDLAIGCSGCWPGSREATAVAGPTAAVFYPRVAHGYEMIPSRQGAQLFSLKIRIEPSWPAAKTRAFPRVVTNHSGEVALVRVLWKLKRLHSRNARASLTALALSEVLCLWPGDQPDNAVDLPDNDDPIVSAALKLIDAKHGVPPTVEDLAAGVHLSPRQLSRRMRAHFGCSPKACIAARRLGRARDMLGEGQLSITEAAEALGFASIHTFSRWFRAQTGVAPSAWRAEPGL